MSQIYSKSSFDRFGDDLSEVILSYLSLEDKTGLECVCRQFQRIIYRRQYELIVDFDKNIFNPLKATAVLEQKFINLTAFESVLKKCEFISYIDINYCKFFEDFESFERMIQLIIKYCNNLTAIEYDFSQNSFETIHKFFETFGPKLKRFELFDNELMSNKNLIFKFCTNIKELKIFKLSHICDENDSKVLVKNLKEIEFNYSNEDSKRLKTIVEQNRNGLELVDIRVSSDCDQNSIGILLEQISALNKLQKLKLNFSSNLIIGYYFVDLFKKIGIQCLKLKSLELNVITERIGVNLEIFQSIKYFKQLNRLNLRLDFKQKVVSEFEERERSRLNSKYLRECQDLTHLILNGIEIEDKFFRYVDINLKRLQYLNVSEANITDITFRSLSELPKLQTLLFNNMKAKQINSSTIYYLISKCPKLKTIKYNTRRDVPIILDDKRIGQIREIFKTQQNLANVRLSSALIS